MSKILHVMIVRRAPRLLPPRGACPNSKGVKALQLAFDRFGGFADQGGHPLPRTPCKAYQPANGFDQRIAVVFKVELESLGHRYCRASWRSAVFSRERQRRALEQENSADFAFDVAGNPKPLHVAADEKRRDRFVDDAGIERLKARDDPWRRLNGRGLAASAFPFRGSRRTRRQARQGVLAHELRGDHRRYSAVTECPDLLRAELVGKPVREATQIFAGIAVGMRDGRGSHLIREK
jgi:hypothetical protein